MESKSRRRANPPLLFSVRFIGRHIDFFMNFLYNSEYKENSTSVVEKLKGCRKPKIIEEKMCYIN